MGDVRTAGVRWDGPYMSTDRERTWIGRIESQAWRTGWAIIAQVREEAGVVQATQDSRGQQSV